MPQIFQTLRCYKCFVFQVHQTKKSIKWKCKMCGEKQSMKRHYGIGTAQDCRLHVQKLNGIRGDIENNSDSSDSESSSDCNEHNNNPKKTSTNRPTKSKWDNFIDKSEENLIVKTDKEETMYLDNIEVVLEIPNNKIKNSFGRKNINKLVELDEVIPNLDQEENKQSCFNRDTNIKDSKVDILKQIQFKSAATNSNYLKTALNDVKDLPKKASKWAQYECEEEECLIFNKEVVTDEVKKPIVGNKQKILSLFDDDNIEDELDF